MLIKNNNKLLIAIALLCSIALAVVIGSSLYSVVSAADENVQIIEGVTYYKGHECAPQQVIIIYEDSTMAKQSAEMITNSNKEVQILEQESIKPTPNPDKTDTPEISVSTDETAAPTESGRKSEDESQSLMTQAEIMTTNKDMVVVEIADSVDMDEYMAEAKNQPGVKYVQPNYIYHIAAAVDDPIPNMNTDGYGWYFHTINTFSAWDYTFGDNSVVVGVIDTGIDIDHPDLQANIIGHWDTAANDGSGNDVDGHGTMVSGFIAAVGNNGSGTTGIAPNCSLIVVDAFEGPTTTSTSYIVAAIDYLMTQGVDIINMSFGAEGHDTTLASKIQQAYDADIVMIAAAGNENIGTTYSPSDQDCVISVMASGISDDYISDYSNYGVPKDITAPGTSIASTYIDGGYASGNGTSFAAPIVSGTVALMLSIDNTLTPAEIANILYSTADDTCTQKSSGGTNYGAGRLNAYEAVKYVYDNLSVTDISISPEDAVLIHDETLQLVPTLTPANPINPNISYTSSDEAIATVSATGLITADSTNNGTAIITATTEGNGPTDTCTITVVDAKVTGVELNPETAHIDIAGTVSLTATVLPVGATNTNVTYSSSDETIATVDTSGVVTGVAMGDAVITVTTEEGSFTDTCDVEVGYHVTGVSVDGGQIDITETLQLTPVISPSNATNKNVTYASADETIATVSETGLVTGVSLGTTTITVTAEDGGFEDTCTIISGYYVDSVSLSPATMEIDVGGNDQVTASVYPSNATNKNVTYSSSDETVATVDAVGVVWAHSAGTTTITVTTEDGSYTDTSDITVVQPVEEVILYPSSHNMIVAETVQLEAAIMPSNATYTGVTYSSSNDAIATVDSTGLVTAHALGDATITITADDGGLTDTCDIHVVEEVITSSTYTVNRAEKFFEDVAIETTVQQIIDAIDNSTGVVHIYNNAMEEVTEGNVSTGYYIQLEIGGTVVDEVRILIEGDCNPDTILDIIDYTLIRLHILDVSSLSGLPLAVADVNDDGIIDIIDYTLVRLHILDVMSLY